MMRFSSSTARVSTADKHLTALGNEELIFLLVVIVVVVGGASFQFVDSRTRKGNAQAELCDSENKITS